jgi:hypothetical protein
VVAPPAPELPTVKAVLSATVVAPFRVTAPVDVAKVYADDEDWATLPFKVTSPLPVLNVPELDEWSKFPADTVTPLSTDKVGKVVEGKINLLAVPSVDVHQAWT